MLFSSGAFATAPFSATANKTLSVVVGDSAVAQDTLRGGASFVESLSDTVAVTDKLQIRGWKRVNNTQQNSWVPVNDRQ